MKERFDRSKPHVSIGTIGTNIKEGTMSNATEHVRLEILGESAENACLVLTKQALINIRHKNATYPLELVINGKKMNIVVMRDTTYNNRRIMFDKMNKEAAEKANKIKESQQPTEKEETKPKLDLV